MFRTTFCTIKDSLVLDVSPAHVLFSQERIFVQDDGGGKTPILRSAGCITEKNNLNKKAPIWGFG